MAGFRVEPDRLTASGAALQNVAGRLAGELSAFQAELSGYGSPWGSDDIGSLIGAAHGEVSSFAFECYQGALEEMQAAGADLSAMGDSYAAVEASIGDRFTHLGSGLAS